MNFKNPYFTIAEKLQLLQRWILVHSILYYELGASIVTDAMFDQNSRQLVELMAEYPQQLKRTKYFYCMYDFDGSTGFDLPSRLSEADRDGLFNNAKRLERDYGK